MFSNSLVKNLNIALGVFEKLQKATIIRFIHSFIHLFVMSVLLSVHLKGTTQLPLNRLSWNFIFEYFPRIRQENSSFIKMWHDYTNTNIHFWSYLLHFFIEWEMFQIKVVEKVKTRILSSITFFLIVLFMRLHGKILLNLAGHKWHKVHTHCMLDTMPTNTHSEYVILIAFPLQQWLHKCDSLLCSTYITCLV